LHAEGYETNNNFVNLSDLRIFF